jgi:hypothetical protein
LSCAWTRPVKVMVGLISSLTAATTVTLGGGAGVSPWLPLRLQAQSSSAVAAIAAMRGFDPIVAISAPNESAAKAQRKLVGGENQIR